MESHHPPTSSGTASLLRVGTFNVHQWSNGNSENTFGDICRLLWGANLDVIGLQEASGRMLPKLLSHLNGGNKTNGYRLADKFGGTAILTRMPMATSASDIESRIISVPN